MTLRPLALAVTAACALACKPDSTAVPPAPPAPPPPAQPASAPASRPAMEGAQAAAADGAPFSGEVRLKEGVAASMVKPTDVLYLMARECTGGDCTKPGRLVAVQQHKSPTLPLAFKVGPESVMMAGTPFAGPFVLQARLDRDGDAMTRGFEDLYAEIGTGVRAGQTGIALDLAPLPPNATPIASPTPAAGAAPAETPLPAGHPAVAPSGH